MTGSLVLTETGTGSPSNSVETPYSSLTITFRYQSKRGSLGRPFPSGVVPLDCSDTHDVDISLTGLLRTSGDTTETLNPSIDFYDLG